MKKISTILMLAAIAIVFQSTVKKGTNSSIPPAGYTGAAGDYCTSCHGSFSLNSGGGSITATGLPRFNYAPNQSYSFSINIAHGSSDRSRWGFAVKAINRNTGSAVGTFSSSNSNAINLNGELSHLGAVSTGPQSSYTYTNLNWTAPATSGIPIDFYYVGNAANGNGDSDGDYIYAGSIAMTLPITLKSFTAKAAGSSVALNWETSSEINGDYFEVEKSDNGQTYYSIGKINALGNTGIGKSYSFTDNKPSYYEKPIFYRLKLVDKDNSYKYSDVASVKLKATGLNIVKAYPTIINTNSTIYAQVYSDQVRTIIIELIDNSGRVLEKSIKEVEKGNSTITFTAKANLSKGWIFAKFRGDGYQQTIPFTVL